MLHIAICDDEKFFLSKERDHYSVYEREGLPLSDSLIWIRNRVYCFGSRSNI